MGLGTCNFQTSASSKIGSIVCIVSAIPPSYFEKHFWARLETQFSREGQRVETSVNRLCFINARLRTRCFRLYRTPLHRYVDKHVWVGLEI